MGLHWLIVNETRREYLDPHQMDDNGKWPVGNTAIALIELLQSGGWSGDVIAMYEEQSFEAKVEAYRDVSRRALALLGETRARWCGYDGPSDKIQKFVEVWGKP